MRTPNGGEMGSNDQQVDGRPKVELTSKQTVASIYIAAPGVERYRDGFRLEGFVSVIDQISDAFEQEFICSEISDNGYYSCNEPLHGKFLAYITKMTEVDSYHDDGVFLMSLTAYGSTNLVANSQVVREPTQIDEVVGSKFDGSY